MPMKELFEFKSIQGNVVKDVSTTSRQVSGYLSKFGNEDLHGDIIETGAFKHSLNARKDKIFFLNQHNFSQPHGFFKELTEDSYGLYFVSEKMANTTYSNDALELYAAGIVKEHSIGFNIVKAYNDDNGIRRIKEVKLWEGSNVTLGANPETPFTGFKNLTLKELNDEINKFMNVLRNGTVTDETMMQLEIGLKIMQTEAFNLGKKEALNNETDPLKDSQKGTKTLLEYLREYNSKNL